MLSIVTGYFLWTAVFAGRSSIFNYSKEQMVLYILGASLVQAVVLSSRTVDLAAIINSGDLSQILLKPVAMFRYWLTQDIADKLLNILFSIAEIGFLWFLLKPSLMIPTVHGLILFGLFLPLALGLYFFINFLFGSLGFWTSEIWAPRFLLFVLLSFVAGNMFPLDILPVWLLKVVYWTPFPYLVYFPTQALLGRLPDDQIYSGLITATAWVAGMYFIAKCVWNKGLKNYDAEGG